MIFLVLTLLLIAVPASAWTAPIGIPDPGFGVTGTAPARTHYVDNSVACNDANNGGLGSPGAPRCTIPTSALAAGASVEVHGGPYVYSTSCSVSVTANGTAESPVYVWGVGKPIIEANSQNGRCFRVQGTYYVIEGFTFGGPSGMYLAVELDGDHGTLRGNDVTNNQPVVDGQGRQFGTAITVQPAAHHMVIYNNQIFGNGNYLSTSDNKMQGFKIPGIAGTIGPSSIWIVDNTFYHNGQAVQMGDDCVGFNNPGTGLCEPEPTAFPSFLYFGRNVMHDDREVGIALKMVQDVVISQNTVYNYVDLPAGTNCATSPQITALNIGRFASNRVWVLFNRVYNTSIGIRSNGQLEGTTGPTPVFPKVYIIGNVISGIVGTSEATGANCVPYSATDPFSGGVAVLGYNNHELYVVDNTIFDATKGISVTSTGYYEVTGNVIANTGDPHTHVPTNWGTNLFDYQFLDPTARLSWSNTTPIIDIPTMQTHSQEANAAQGNALLDANGRPASGSPVINTNVRSAVYDTFFSLYGLNIDKDFDGRSRPLGAAWDRGAFEVPPGTLSGSVTLSGTVTIK